MEIRHRPCSEANLLAWHSNGLVLATASSGRGGKLSILAYDKRVGFTAKTVLQCPEGESVTSLCWANIGRRLVLALCPSATLCFFRVNDEDPQNLENLGNVKYPAYFDTSSEILLTADFASPLYAYSNNKLLRFEESRKQQVTFKLTAVMNAPVGIRAIVYDEVTDGLFTMAADNWTFWKIENASLKQIATASDDEKSKRKGDRKSKRNPEYTAIAVSSSGKYLATGGHDTLWCFDIIDNEDGKFEIRYKGRRNKAVNWGVVTCIDFHPMDDQTRLIALGGDTGCIYIWAVVDRGKLKSKYTELERSPLYLMNPFTDQDKRDDRFVVSDPKCPTVILKLEDILDAQDIAHPEDDESASQSSRSTIPSPIAANVPNVSPAAILFPDAAIDSSAAADSSAAGISLADKFNSLKEEAQKSIGELSDIASQAVDNIVSLGAEADGLLKKKGHLTTEEMTAFLEKVSSARHKKIK